MNIIKYLLCKNSGMSNGESFLRASTNMPISGGAAKFIEKTVPFADIISITDALARPAVDLQTEITATQNLNGYEYPWVGGAGKNKLDVEDLSIAASSSVTIPISESITLAQGTYTFSWTLEKTITAIRNRPCYISSGSYIYAPSDYKTSGRGSWTFTLEEEKTLTFAWWTIDNSDAITLSDFQLEEGSTAPTEWTPYENICPISGRTEVNVTRTGVNVWDEEWKQGDIVSSSGIEVTGDKVISKNYCEIKPNTSYYIIAPSEGNMGVFYYDENKTFISMIWSANRAITTPSNAKYFKLRFPSQYGTAYANDGGLLYPSTATAYEPYEGDTFNTELGRTVYGGTLDLTTDELTITHAYVDLGDLTWTTSLSLETPNLFEAYINNKKDGYTNFTTTSYRTVKKLDTMLANGEATGTTITIDEPMAYIFVKDERATTAADFKTLVTGQKMVYELATPQTISLTPTEVMMLENNNTIWADSGRVQLTYYAPKEE